jgi:hypothetical protein
LADAGLGQVLAESHALLKQGVRDAASPWRFMALGTVRADGGATVRTVVLRDFQAEARTVDIYTDARSAKCAELRAQKLAALHGWDSERRVQLRLCGPATVEVDGPAAEAAWARLGGHGRGTYDVLPGPGTRLLSPDYAMHDPDPVAARAVFALVRLRFDRLEYLSLPAVPGQGVHRRAVFEWRAGGISQEWVVP